MSYRQIWDSQCFRILQCGSTSISTYSFLFRVSSQGPAPSNICVKSIRSTVFRVMNFLVSRWCHTSCSIRLIGRHADGFLAIWFKSRTPQHDVIKYQMIQNLITNSPVKSNSATTTYLLVVCSIGEVHHPSIGESLITSIYC